MKRVFLAVDITPGTELLAAFDLMRKKLSTGKINWVPSRQWHITLAFLGEMQEDVLPRLVLETGKALEPHKSFELALSGIGIFKNMRDIRVIWVGINTNPAFRKIKEALDQVLAGFGYRSDNRVFSPHLTLGRIREMRDPESISEILSKYGNVIFQKETVDQVVLYESKLKPEGPEYFVLNKFNIKR